MSYFTIIYHSSWERWQTYTYNSQVPPVQHVAESLRSVPLNDALPPVESRKLEHVLRQLLHAVLQPDVPPVYYVDTIRHRIRYVFLHETPKTCNKPKRVSK